MKSIPSRVVKMALAGTCGVAAAALAAFGMVVPLPDTVRYAVWGTAGAAVILLGQAVLPSNKEER